MVTTQTKTLQNLQHILATTMERGDGVTQLAGTVAVEIFTAQKGHSEFYFSHFDQEIHV